MTDKKDVKALSVDELENNEAYGDIDAKRELARRLVEEEHQNEAKAVALLEECVALGDTEAMLMLAKCCANGLGMEQSTERAKALISEAEEKGNDDALFLMWYSALFDGVLVGLDGLSFSFNINKRHLNLCILLWIKTLRG